MFVHDEAYYESRKPLPNLGVYRNFLRFIYDKDRKTFLDRTCKDWGSVLLFYFFFFGGLFGIFSLQMWLSMNYVSKFETPMIIHHTLLQRSMGDGKIRVHRSPLMGFSNPGMGFKPNILLQSSSPVIWINPNRDSAKPQRYIDAIDQFLADYTKNASFYEECIDGQSRPNIYAKPCPFDISALGVCGKPPYGYSNPVQPCVYIKFNKKLNWIPVHYNRTSELPEEVPKPLEGTIKSSSKHYIWVSCDGVSNVDKEYIGKVQYLPQPGFGIQYFPFFGQDNYVSPVVALHFENLTVNRLITIECTIWAQNVDNSPQHRLNFQILIDHERT